MRPEAARRSGRHAAPTTDEADRRVAPPAGAPARSSWHYSLWSQPGGDAVPEPGGLRLVPDLEPAATESPTPAPAATAPTGPASTQTLTAPAVTEPIPPGTTPPGISPVVSRLAQLLREDPSLAAGWGREATDS